MAQLGTLQGLATMFANVGPETIPQNSALAVQQAMAGLANRSNEEERSRSAGLAELFSGVKAKDPNQTPRNLSKYADTWSKLYQTTRDPEKEKSFALHVNQLYGNAPKEREIRQAIETVMPAFADEAANRGMESKDLHELMYQTALHESLGGKFNKQMGDGPARSWWQVEPDTAYDNIKNYPQALGSGFEKATGYSKEDLQAMSKEELGTLMEKDPNFAASMGMLWYLRKMPKYGGL